MAEEPTTRGVFYHNPMQCATSSPLVNQLKSLERDAISQPIFTKWTISTCYNTQHIYSFKVTKQPDKPDRQTRQLHMGVGSTFGIMRGNRWMAFLFKLMIGREPFSPFPLFPARLQRREWDEVWAPGPYRSYAYWTPPTNCTWLYFVCIHLMSHRQLSADPFSIECFH